LKEQKSAIRTIGVDPYGSVYYKYFHTGEFDQTEIYPYITEGVGEDILAGNMDFTRIDDFVRVDDRSAQRMTRRLAREEGIFAGQSSGLAVSGAIQWIESNRDALSSADVVVVLLPDSGFRYLSKTYNDDWMRGHGFLDEIMEITVAGVLERRRGQSRVCSVSSHDTITDAVSLMARHGISQVPVLDQDQLTGSVTEKGVLNHLIEHPGAASEPIGSVMEDPFPVVSPGLGLGELSSLLDAERGAVLVKSADGYEILTKADLIAALAGAGRGGPAQQPDKR
jgi:cystathionine beta-synthase